MPASIMNGALILLLLRDSASSWKELCDKLGIDLVSPAEESNRIYLSEMLVGLRNIGLVQYRGKTPQKSSKIKSTGQWEQIQTAIGRPKLADITAISDNARGVVVKPIFGRVIGDHKPAQVFVLMPFNAELSELHKIHFKRLEQELGVTIKRADELYSLNESFMTKVWRAIYFADLIIADCTQKNPNVFYEIGLAHVLGKPVVFITRSDDDIPSDIKHLDFIEYKYDNEGVDSLLVKLAGIIREKLNLASP